MRRVLALAPEQEEERQTETDQVHDGHGPMREAHRLEVELLEECDPQDHCHHLHGETKGFLVVHVAIRSCWRTGAAVSARWCVTKPHCTRFWANVAVTDRVARVAVGPRIDRSLVATPEECTDCRGMLHAGCPSAGNQCGDARLYIEPINPQ